MSKAFVFFARSNASLWYTSQRACDNDDVYNINEMNDCEGLRVIFIQRFYTVSTDNHDIVSNDLRHDAVKLFCTKKIPMDLMIAEKRSTNSMIRFFGDYEREKNAEQ